jgi:tetratricopeptide (TPR) repeat protein
MDATVNQDPRAGIQLYLNQDYAGAVAQLSDALKVRPDWAEGWSYLGYAQYMQQRFTEAGASLEKAVMMDQESAEARFGLGLVWAAMKRVDAAIACWNETLRIKPGHADAKRSLIGALIYRAQAYLADKDYDHAESDLERAIKVDRTAAAPVVLLANHFIDQNMTVRAEKTIREALAYVPNDGQIQALALKLNVQAADKGAQAAAQDMQARQQVMKSQEVPCPACKRPIMEWAAICPHCSTQIKALPSTFAGRQAAVAGITWQDVVYYVLSSIWVLNGTAILILAIATGGIAKSFEGFTGFVTSIYLLMALVGVGLLFKMDTAMYIAKILCYIVLVLGLPYFILLFLAGGYIGAFIGLLAVTTVCMMIYLLNYMGAGE